MNTKLIDLIRKYFHARLQAKTGWGRNDVMEQFNLALIDAMSEYLDDK